ncbi:MAG TPA: hypothetical protein DCO82_10230 [Alphaproteobacteria bacterium]|nr:hypothetical protein [Alphaproteobacteria bacterium]
MFWNSFSLWILIMEWRSFCLHRVAAFIFQSISSFVRKGKEWRKSRLSIVLIKNLLVNAAVNTYLSRRELFIRQKYTVYG